MEDGLMPKKDPKDTGGSTAPKQPDREQVQEWEDEGGATKPSAQKAQSNSPSREDEEPTDEPRGPSGVKRPASRAKSRSRTGR
jgi:hypothetical protein